jgi:hypothetical protein
VGVRAATGGRFAEVGGRRHIENEFQFHNHTL